MLSLNFQLFAIILILFLISLAFWWNQMEMEYLLSDEKSILFPDLKKTSNGEKLISFVEMVKNWFYAEEKEKLTRASNRLVFKHSKIYERLSKCKR